MANNIIKGRKGGDSKPRTPTEQPNDLQSAAKAKILIALGEGEFAGGLTGKNIYRDGTPLENADGSQNFSGVYWEFRPGTQAQTYIQGIPGTENEISVGTEVSSKTAWTHTFTNTQLSAVRVRLKWPSLMKQEDDGDVVGNTVEYAIDLQTDGGAWQTVLETAVTGKATSGYERSHRIDLPQAGSTWTLRLRKITPDANSVKVGDVMTLQSYTEVIDAKLRYPNTALLYIEFDASQLNGSIPQISCEPRGRVIRVPDNYNPETREYTGVWTGGFKWAWTDNPAWIYYDIVTADRFGLGNRLSSANISKWTLYQIAQYCDQLVPDGRGGDGMEPRYTCNVYVQERNDAYTVLRDFAAIFRGMTCWNGEQIVVQADMPRDVDFTYTRANIVGKPRYSSSSSQVRYTNALISWSDPDNAYADAMEPAFIPELVSRYSFNQLEMTAIGCTRQSEAHRKGLWGILTNNKDRVVEFDVGLDGRIPQPGYIIALADELLAGRVNGGRISAVNGRVITLDRDVDAKPGDRLQLNLPSGISQSRTIQAVNGRRQITVTTAYSETPERECVWAIESDDLFLQQYRVTGVKENSDATLTITGVAHDPDKFARIDTGAIIDQRPVSVLPTGNQSPPDDIVITSRSVVNQGISVETMQVNWSAVSGAIAYEAQWRRNDGNWINVPRSSTTSFEVSGIYAGRYLVRVRAINAVEISSGWAYSEEKTLTGKVGEPLAPLALSTVSLTAGIEIRWEFPAGAEDTQRTELQYSPDQNGNGALPLTDLAYPGKKYQQMGLQIATQFWYRARLVDRLGNASSWTDWVHGMSSDNVSDYFQQLDEAIKDTETYQSLVKEIDTRAVAEEVDSAIEAAKKDVASQVTDAKQEAQQLVQDTRNDIEQALADEALARASAIAQESADRTAAIAREAAELSDAIAREAADRAYALADEARARATAISDAVKDEAAARSKAIADEAQKRNDAIAAENAARVKAVSELDTRTADALANETAERIRAVSSEAKARADALLNEENNREAAISSLSSQLQTAAESLAQQISQVAAGTGEQFDPLNIWYFDTNNEGWTEDDNGYTPMIVTDDGWLKADNSTSSARSPNNLDINAAAYRFIKFRLKKVGNPAWKGRLLWIGADESAWDYARSVVIDEPEYDVNDTATVTLHDIPWLSSQRIRRFRLDLAQGQNEENYFLIDWLAVGRPTPGAGMAALQNEQLARTQADAAEAANRQDLAVQLRGSYDGNDLTKVSSGLIYQEQQARVTGDKAEASARQSLETRINNSLSTINQSLDTLNTADEAMASDITGLKSSLAGKADASALTTLKTQVTAQGDTLASQGASLTNLQNSLNRLSSDVSKKADATAVQSLQNQLTQQGKDITAANSSITNLKSSLETTNSNVSKKADATAVNDLTSRVTSAEGKVSSQGNSITRLNNSLNNVIADSDAAAAIPGNLIVNPSFERGTDGYIGVSAQSTVVAIQAPRTGTRALKVDPGSVAPGQTIDFVKDRTYEVGVWVKQIAGTTDNGAGNNKLRIGNSAGNPVLEVPYTGAGTDWTKYSKRWKATETARLPVTLNNYLTAGNRYFDDFYVIDVTDSVNIDANASAIASVQNMVTQQGKDITSQSSSITDLKNSLKTTDANVAKKADASAVQTLQNTVEQQGRDITTASSDISGLKNSLSTTDANVAKKADASALGALQSTVTQQGKDITSAGNSITQLQNSLASTNSAVNKKADAQALSALTGRVSDAEGKLSSQSDQLSTLENSLRLGSLISNGSLDNDATFWVNSGSGSAFVYEAAEKALRTTTGSIRIANTTRIPVEVGMTLTLSFEFKTTEAISAISSDSVGFITDPNDQTNWLVSQASWLTAVTTEWQRQTLTFTIPDKFTGQYVYLRFAAGGWSPSNSARLYLKNIEVYSSTGIAGKADASAVNDLSSRVEAAEGSITSQGNSLTNLRNSLNTTNANVSKKADASALQSLQNTVTQQGKTLSSASSDLSSLKNRLDITDGNVAKKADASALQNLQNTVSQQGNTLSSQASQLTRLNNSLTTTQSALDAVKADVDASVPGNLLVNSTFERGQDGWNGWTSQASVVELQKPRSGKMALRLAPASGTAALQQNISVLGGHTYELSAWTKVAAGTTMAPGSAANNKLRIGNLDGSAVADKQLDPATISTTTWQQTTLRYKPATDRTITVGLMYYLSAGIQYYDDVTFTDITDRIDIDANANATSNLDSRVTAAEGKVTSQGNSLVSLRNDLTAVQSDITKKADASALQNLQNTVSQQGDALSSQSDLVTMLENSLSEGSLIGNGSLKTDATLWEDSGTGSGFTWDASEKAIRTTTGSVRVANITRIPVEAGVSLTVTFEFKMSEAITAYSSDTVGFITSLSDPVNWLTAQSPWLDGVTTQWQSRTVTLDIPATFTGRYVYLRFAAGGWSPANSARLYLRNIDVTSATGVANKADASAVSSLSGRVDTVEGKVTSQASDLTSLRNSLNTTNNNVSKKADTTALQSLQNKVEQQGNDISSAGSQITELNAAILAAKAAGDDYIPNPSLDPAYNRMGYTVQASDADGVPAGCPFAYVIRLASRDHIPGINNIAVTPGDVFEMSALVACGAGSADFNFYIGRATTVTGGIKARSSGGNTKATAAWTRVTWRFTVPSDTNLMRPFLQVNQSSPFGTIWYATDWHLRNVTAANKAQNTADNTASAVESLTTKVTQQGDMLSSIGSRTTTLENGLKTTNASVSKKADADTVQTLQNTVTQQGKDITAANSAITKLTGDLSTTNANVNRKADATALSSLQNTVTDQGQKLTSQGSSLTQLANTLSDAMTSLAADGKIPGNMISNGSFERGQDAFTGWNNVTSVIDAQSPNFGSRILMCAVGLAGITQKVPVVKGNTYKIGVFARAQGGSVMQDRNNNKLRIGGTSLLYDRQFDTANLPTDSSWVELTGTWKSTVDGMVDVSIYSSLKSGAQYFDDFYLVDVTDEVNISANAGAISGLTTRVTNAEGKVTSQGNSITSLQNSLNTINSNVSKKADAEALQNLKNTVTQQGKDISTQSSNITSLQNSLNTANAGIDSLVADNDASKRFVGNLLANPSFERGLTGYSGGGAFITVIDAQSPNTGGRILSCGTGTGAVSQSVDVTKDRTYKIGVFTRCQAGSVLDAQGNNKLRIGSASLLYELQFRPTSSSWVELTGTWKATITGKVDVSINSSLKSGYQYFDDFYFIDITDRVDLDATSNAVSSLTSRVTNAEGTISSHTGSITSLNNSLSSLNKTVSGKADSSTVQALQNTVTQQGKDLAANASSLTSINASLSTLQSQGLNPWIDGSFESYAAGKSLYGDTAIVTTDVSRNGSKSLKITRKAGETGNSDKMLGKWLSVRGGGKYRFSFWAYMDSDMSAPNAWSAIVGLYARGENGGANQWPGAVTINETNITRGKWTFLTGVASVAADRSIAQMWISTRGPSGGAGFSLYLDDINIVDVTDAQAAQTDATAAANAVTQLTATVSQQGRDITAQAKQFTALQSSLNSTDARIARQDETIAANGLAMANGFNQMRSMIGDNSAAITTTNKTVTDLEKSTTESMTQLTSQVGDMSASVQQTASTVADLNGKLSAQWGVKVGTSSGGKHYVSGLQLGMDASGQSQFLVQADQFGVYVPNGDKSNLVFGVDGNGAYMQQAMARNLTINFGQITDSLQSTDYQPASTGWRLPKSGAFEMNGSVPGEGRVQLDSSGLAVYDQNGVLRCKIGRI
ncbi:TPA: DUF1983 domain-containing protein [Klebsiella pneumoniae subsp. pneumoniae]|nr:DUF1983 domain-containing protein [Klebsiella pneumoniae subsp. pneumoniae]